MKNVFYLLVILLLLCSCKETDKERITRLVKEWDSKEILFPQDIVYTVYAKDTVDYSVPQSSYTIVSYIDSVGCTSCKLQLFRWKEYMEELDSISQGSAVCRFIFHPKSAKELTYLLRRDGFDYPVWIDNEDSFNKMNTLPVERVFHTFLLNDKNRVVAMGDPVQNPRIKELYQRIIRGEEKYSPTVATTTVDVNKLAIDLGEFDWHEFKEVTFVLYNIGKHVLVVNDIITSCGCIKVKYSNQPVRPGEQLDIVVTYKADNPEYIDKSLKVYANIDSSPLVLKVKGMTREVN